MPSVQKNHRATNKQKMMSHSKITKLNQTLTIEKDLIMAHQLDKYFETPAVMNLKKVKKDVEKVRKTKYE